MDDDRLQGGKGDVQIQRGLTGANQVQGQHHQPPFNKNRHHVVTGSRQPVHGFHRMMDSVVRPQFWHFVEQPVLPVQHEIGHQYQQQYLDNQR